MPRNVPNLYSRKYFLHEEMHQDRNRNKVGLRFQPLFVYLIDWRSHGSTVEWLKRNRYWWK